MGVRGLSTFFNNNPELSKSYKLRNTTVIIDGNNLIHQLYFKSKVDFVFGGEYYKYAASVRKFFLSLFECEIRPILVLDGGYDLSDRKFQTTLSRLESRLSFTQQVVKYGNSRGGFLPINAVQVFLQVAREMSVCLVQAPFEADEHVTALANHFRCPVLSEDSDFYIFDIPGGFIRLSSLHHCGGVEEERRGKYLPCTVYHIDSFLAYFPQMNRSILPLFAALIGNDFVDGKDFRKFFSNIQLPKVKGLRLNPKQKQIMGLLSWLKDWELEYGIEQVLCRLTLERRPRIETILKKCVQCYATQRSPLIHVVRKELDILLTNYPCVQPLPSDIVRNEFEILANNQLGTFEHPRSFDFVRNELDTLAENELVFPCGHPLPPDFVVAFYRGQLPPDFSNVIHLHRVFLKGQVEDSDRDSSYDCSRAIRQVMYGILLQHDASMGSHSERCLRHVDEYNRRKRHLVKETIPSTLRLKSGKEVPSLDLVYSSGSFKDLFIEVMEAADLSLDSIPCNWQVLCIAIRFWLKNTSSAPPEEFVIAVILNIIYFDVILTLKSSSHVSNKSVTGNLSISALLETITLEEAEFASESVKKYLHQPIVNHAKGLRVDLIHSYSELQTCLFYANQMNSLLKHPLTEGPPLVSGILLYNLTRDLLFRPLPHQFAGQLLGLGSALETLYHVMKALITDELRNLCQIQVERLSRKKRRKPKVKNAFDMEPIVDSCDDGQAEIYI